VGKSSEIKKIKNSLKNLKVKLTELSWDKFDVKNVTEKVQGIILVDLAASPFLDAALSGIRNKLRADFPVFTIVSINCFNLKVRNLYKLGSSAVFEWPRESLILARLFAEILGMEWVRGSPSKGDLALARNIRAHFRIMDGIPKNMKLKVSEGMVYLSGTIGSYSKKKKIEEIVVHIPGVTGVHLESLRVPPSSIPDHVLSKKIEKTLKITKLIDEKTLTYEVENGNVVLAGTTANGTELRNLLQIISEVEGIRDIRDLTTISAKEKRKDHEHAQTLQGTLKRLFPEQKISIKYFGGVAVLTGTVESLPIKKRIQNEIRSEGYVQRIVNKLQIRK
jgi:osmotically-inducible protein OsmY